MSKSVQKNADIYPAYCFTSSPTFNKWVKLTAADVHGLRELPTFADQGIYFHLNHPVRFVYLCGTIIRIRPIPEGSTVVPYFVILDVDDGSGKTIEVKVKISKSTAQSTDAQVGSRQRLAHPHSQNGHQLQPEVPSLDEEEADELAKRAFTFSEYTKDTSVDNIKVTNACSIELCRDVHVVLNGEPIDLYTMVKVKGTMTLYNDIRQINLERAFFVRTTDEEVRVWEEYISFSVQVLARPWRLHKNQLRKLERLDREQIAKMDFERDAKQRKTRERERIAEKRREEHRSKEAAKEAQRQSERAMLDGNALDRPVRRVWPAVSHLANGTKKP